MLNFEEIIVNAWSLPNYGDVLVDGMKNGLYDLECRTLHAKCNKKSKFFSFIKIRRNAYVS